MAEAPKLGDYMAKWSKVNVVAHEQERSAREEYSEAVHAWQAGEIALLKAALRWSWQFVNFTPMADGSFLDCNNGERVTAPSEFAALIAEATKP